MTKTCQNPPMTIPPTTGTVTKSHWTPEAMPLAMIVVTGPIVSRVSGTIMRTVIHGVIKLRKELGIKRLQQRST